MKYFNKLDTFYFILGFSIGIFIVYITKPARKIVYKHPTPDNTERLVYHDNAENCYKYVAEEITCPDDPTQVFSHPLVLG